jgi:hypothetical protein
LIGKKTKEWWNCKKKQIAKTIQKKFKE